MDGIVLLTLKLLPYPMYYFIFNLSDFTKNLCELGPFCDIQIFD